MISRKQFAVAVTAAGFLIGIAGCPNSGEVKVPTQTSTVPNDPFPAGAGKGGKDNTNANAKAVD